MQRQRVSASQQVFTRHHATPPHSDTLPSTPLARHQCDATSTVLRHRLQLPSQNLDSDATPPHSDTLPSTPDTSTQCHHAQTKMPCRCRRHQPTIVQCFPSSITPWPQTLRIGLDLLFLLVLGLSVVCTCSRTHTSSSASCRGGNEYSGAPRPSRAVTALVLGHAASDLSGWPSDVVRREGEHAVLT